MMRSNVPMAKMASYSADNGMMMAESGALAAPITALATQVNASSVGSTSTFEIPRNTTIPSDNTSHKVTIGILNLKVFIYQMFVFFLFAFDCSHVSKLIF